MGWTCSPSRKRPDPLQGAHREVCQQENDNDQALYRRMCMRRDPFRNEQRTHCRDPLPVPGLPETKRYGAWIHLTFPQRADVTITGEAKNWRVAGDSGNEKVHAFCPTCGTPVYLTFLAMPDLIAVHAASLDDPSQFDPQLVTYSIRGHAWDMIDPSLQKFERMPAS